ncbi:MAG TPA: thioredoxin family protein [Saprospiraceae bacterium]|nr:thioredoxin family protein [Saprospiraceae bacterium]HMQ84988.1 thioredoxin family protein [Saprospiraceae bacterium]
MRILIVILVLASGIYQSATAQGMDFFHGSWSEALEKAKQEDKVIFIDAYAEWCGPCKRMAASVFPDEKVGTFFNKYFVNLKLDMEKGEGLEFRKKYPVSAFPTLFFINGAGEVVHSVRGAQSIEGFLQLGQKVLGMADNSAEYEARYEKGERDPEFLLSYMKSLNRAGKSSLKVANEYLNAQRDLSSEFNLRFLHEATTACDSRIFDLYIGQRQQEEALLGKAAVQQRILEACQSTAQKSIEFKTNELLKEAQQKMKDHYPEKAEWFALSTEMDFCLAMKNGKEFSSACKKYADKIAADNPDELYRLTTEIVKNFGEDSKAMKVAEGLAKDAADQSKNYVHHLTYAQVLLQNGKQDEALQVAKNTLEMAKAQSPIAVKSVESFIQRIEG